MLQSTPGRPERTPSPACSQTSQNGSAKFAIRGEPIEIDLWQGTTVWAIPVDGSAKWQGTTVWAIPEEKARSTENAPD